MAVQWPTPGGPSAGKPIPGEARVCGKASASWSAEACPGTSRGRTEDGVRSEMNATILNGRCKRQQGLSVPLTEKMTRDDKLTKDNKAPPGSVSKAPGPKAPSTKPVPTRTSRTEPASSSEAPVHQDDAQLAAGLEEIEALEKRIAEQKGAILEEMALRYNANGDAEMEEWLRAPTPEAAESDND
eukprot:s126_g11.t1